MHYFKGRNRWTIAVVLAIVLVLAAVIIQSLNMEQVPMAPGPFTEQTSTGGL
jgi:hypothetical protein